jgi:hypothetical protein
MNVREDPRNSMLTNGASAVSSVPPKISIQRKSAVRPRKEPFGGAGARSGRGRAESEGAEPFGPLRHARGRRGIALNALTRAQRDDYGGGAMTRRQCDDSPSSRLLQYFTRKNMWKTKSSPSDPKKKKLVSSRQTSPRRKMRLVLK